MRVLWLGINDEHGCVLHWHDLRCRLRDEHGVTLAGPGYSWDMGTGPRYVSQLVEKANPDWVVLDDCNALGYVPLIWDQAPKCRVAWREHDWHNRFRQEAGVKIKPDLILSCYERSLPVNDRFRDDPHRVFMPHAVSTHRFHPGNGQVRTFDVGIYGTTSAGYEERREAKKAIRTMRNSWCPVHGGYWKDGRGSGPVTRYNDELAADLRRLKCMWVSSGKWNGVVLKYFEGAASGCMLFGVRPDGWERCFPEEAMVECPPEEAQDVAEWYAKKDSLRQVVAEKATTHCLEHHSVEARASQIMEVLHGAS